jgi:hypothetical protein
MPAIRSGMWGIFEIKKGDGASRVGTDAQHPRRIAHATGVEAHVNDGDSLLLDLQDQAQCDINFGPSPHLEPYLATKEGTPSNETGVDSRRHRDCL